MQPHMHQGSAAACGCAAADSGALAAEAALWGIGDWHPSAVLLVAVGAAGLGGTAAAVIVAAGMSSSIKLAGGTARRQTDRAVVAWDQQWTNDIVGL
jgi:hypothetical protein